MQRAGALIVGGEGRAVTPEPHAQVQCRADRHNAALILLLYLCHRMEALHVALHPGQGGARLLTAWWLGPNDGSTGAVAQAVVLVVHMITHVMGTYLICTGKFVDTLVLLHRLAHMIHGSVFIL